MSGNYYHHGQHASSYVPPASANTASESFPAMFSFTELSPAGGVQAAMSSMPGTGRPPLMSHATSPMLSHPATPIGTAASTTAQTPVAQTPVEQPAAAFLPFFSSLFNPPPNSLSVTFQEAKKVSKSPNWTFSHKLNKLFCKNVTPVTFLLQTSQPIPLGSELHVAAWKNGVIVTRCPNHQFKVEDSEVHLFDVDKTKFVVAEGCRYIERNDGGEYLVLPIGNDHDQSCTYPVVMYFMCFSSCNTISRKELRLQLRIEHGGQQLCHTAVLMRVCACPGRDRLNFEKRVAEEKEEQGGSACAESPYPNANPGDPVLQIKRAHSSDDVDDEEPGDDGDDIVRHQLVIEGSRRTVTKCVRNLIDNANQQGIRVGGAEMSWYTGNQPTMDPVAVTSSSPHQEDNALYGQAKKNTG